MESEVTIFVRGGGLDVEKEYVPAVKGKQSVTLIFDQVPSHDLLHEIDRCTPDTVDEIILVVPDTQVLALVMRKVTLSERFTVEQKEESSWCTLM